jgi:hypothetical protein
MNTRFLVRVILAAAGVAAFNASAADLKDVYSRALTSDPLIREAEANRLATRESKPQAVACRRSRRTRPTRTTKASAPRPSFRRRTTAR